MKGAKRLPFYIQYPLYDQELLTMQASEHVQQQLAKDSGFSLYTVNKLYNEKWSQVDKLTITKLCETLNVGVGDLFIYVDSIS